MRLTIKKAEFKNASLDIKLQFILMGIFLPLLGAGFGLLLIYARFFGHEVPTKNDLIEIKGSVIEYTFDRQGIRNDFNTIIRLDNYQNGFIVRQLNKKISHELFAPINHPKVTFWIDKIRQEELNTNKNILTYGLKVNDKTINRLVNELDTDSDAKKDFPIIGLGLLIISFILYQKYLRRIINEKRPAANMRS